MQTSASLFYRKKASQQAGHTRKRQNSKKVLQLLWPVFGHAEERQGKQRGRKEEERWKGWKGSRVNECPDGERQRSLLGSKGGTDHMSHCNGQHGTSYHPQAWCATCFPARTGLDPQLVHAAEKQFQLHGDQP